MAFWKGRYTVTLIMFIAWILSYVDRMVMSVSIPYISRDFHLAPVAAGVLMSSFFFGYALMQIPAGMLADRFGVRKVITVGLIWWSAFTALTAWAGTYAVMLLVRVLFGLGEACLPPSYFKSIAIWTPLKERATMNSIVMSSNSLGPALAPLFAVAIIAMYGWRSVFSFLFVPGIILAALVWLFVAEKPEQSRWISKQEVEEINAGTPLARDGKGSNLRMSDGFKSPVVWKVLCTLFICMIAAWGYMSVASQLSCQGARTLARQDGTCGFLSLFRRLCGSDPRRIRIRQGLSQETQHLVHNMHSIDCRLPLPDLQYRQRQRRHRV